MSRSRLDCNAVAHVHVRPETALLPHVWRVGVGRHHQRYAVIAIGFCFVALATVGNRFPVGGNQAPAPFPAHIFVLDELHG